MPGQRSPTGGSVGPDPERPSLPVPPHYLQDFGDVDLLPVTIPPLLLAGVAPEELDLGPVGENVVDHQDIGLRASKTFHRESAPIMLSPRDQLGESCSSNLPTYRLFLRPPSDQYAYQYGPCGHLVQPGLPQRII